MPENNKSVRELKNIIERINSEIKAKECEGIDNVLMEIKSLLQNELEEQISGIKDSILERKKIEEKLALFYEGIEQSADSIVFTNLAGDMIYVNKQFVDLTGYSYEEAIGQNPRILKSGDQSEMFYKNLWNTITAGKVWQGLFHNKKKNGELYWEDARIFPVFDEDGKIKYYGAVKQDVTQRVAAEEKNKHLIEAQRVINALLNSVTTDCTVEHIYSISLKHLLELKWLGVTSEALFLRYDDEKLNVATSINLKRDMITLLNKHVAGAELVKVINEKKVKFISSQSEFLGEKLDESHFLIPVSTSGKIYGAIILLLDKKFTPKEEHYNFLSSYGRTVGLVLDKKSSDIKISEYLSELEKTYTALKKETNEKEALLEKLTVSEKQYREIFESFVDVYYRVNINGIIELVSPSIKDVTGWEPEELIGKSTDVFFANPEEKEGFFQTFMDIGFLKNYEISMYRKDGSIAIISFNSKVIYKNGEPVATQGTFRDVTELKEAEKKLAEANARLEEEVATKDKFFSIISHDLRSPFTALLGYTRMIDDDFDSFSREELQEAIKALHSTSENLFELLEGLLTWSRIQRGVLELNPENVNLNEVVNELFELMHPVADKKQIALINETLPNTMVYADPDMLRGIIRNLVSNSLKFTPEGGTISIKHFAEENVDSITVSDTGIGIDKNNLDKIFRIDVHHTTPGTNNEPGTGLGLILVKELVEKHGGVIEIESEKGKGTNITFTLPKKK